MSNSTIYRGHDIVQNDINGQFEWRDVNGRCYTNYETEEAAMNAIDAHKRELAKGAA